MHAPADLPGKIISLLDGLGSGPLLVHTDLLRAGLPFRASEYRREALLHSHCETLSEVAQTRDIWIPTFNYKFPHSGVHDVRNHRSEIGPLTEYFRTHMAHWRSAVPIFSFAGTGPPPPDHPGPSIDPFGPRSAYDHLVNNHGVYFAYGAPFGTANILHYAERRSGGPMYRYDKYFPGRVILEDGSVRPVVLLYHVRPWQTGLDYDYPRLLADLVGAGVCRVWEPGPLRFIVASTSQLVKFWLERLANDPLYLLNNQSRSWVEPMLHRLGRRFQLEDFEPSQRPGVSQPESSVKA